MSNRQLRPCAHCGQPIPWLKHDIAERYARKRFCSPDCRDMRAGRWTADPHWMECSATEFLGYLERWEGGQLPRPEAIVRSIETL